MRKQSVITNEQGFIFPYICFLAAVILIVVTASLSLYQNHLQLTRLQTERIKIETLLQMGSVEFNQFIMDENSMMQDHGQITYDYPYGQVKVLYTIVNGEVVAEYQASTNQSGKYIIRSKIKQKS
ncbi:hypothetical protein NC661_01195 [Aquibacillus koreensis]|uniref:ComG operon protein 7 n=1 Tax=Aquibacillus koreensis TaxID=279446 RepID=A0A9X3WI27_9BACI|nr:hypothetical protein [Aquibacillus koreensis]MCT2537552.1 hypothetical protein [Aquibacillus koreensis]MDC3418998.1 hypothetical protein [Aquibacillus koreensis]